MTTTDAERDIIRKWLLEEATNTGPVAADATGPSVSADTWRYPYWPAHDVGWEEER